MTIRIISWNTQGDGIRKVSEAYSDITISNGGNILLLQEAGVKYDRDKPLTGNVSICFGQNRCRENGIKSYKGYFVQHEEAVNKRCTTGILAQDSLEINLYHLDLQTVRRPLVIGNIMLPYIYIFIATIHATAESHTSVKEIKQIIDRLSQNARELGRDKWQWILMGDFNAEPAELVAHGISKDNIVHSGCPTHQWGKEFDYAIVSDGLKGKLVLSRGMFYDSDHCPVFMDIDTFIS